MTPDGRDELAALFDTDAEFGDVVAALAAAIPPVEPPPGVKAALFARLSPPPDIRFRFATDGAFAPTPYPGVAIRVLNVDRERRQFSAVIRLDAGATYPSHAHDGPEECVVLEGELLVGDVRMRPGDYQRAEPGSAHSDQWSETGALLFVTGPMSLLAQ